MSGLFSHASSEADVPSERPDIRASVSVPSPPDHAWAGLTDHLHLWWPAELLSRWGEGSFFDLEGNALVETSAQDDENVWGEVIDRAPGQLILLTWRHAGSAVTTELRLEVSTGASPAVQADGGGRAEPSGVDEQGGARAGTGIETKLTLTHSGWTSAEPEELYHFYQDLWPAALGRYRRFMGGS